MFSKKTITLFLISLVAFIDFMGIGLVYPMFSSMLFHSHSSLIAPDTSETTRGLLLGLLLAMMPTTQFFSAPILGLLSDERGRKKILVPSLAIGVAGYLIAVLAVNLNSLLLLLLSRVAVGISAGTAAVVGAALADISTKEEKAKNFGLFNMACGLGFTVGPFLGGYLSSLDFSFIESYSTPFAAAALMTLINLVLILFLFEETYLVKKKSTISFTSGIQNIKRAFQTPHLKSVFLAVFLGCLGWSFYWEFIPVTWISEYHFTASSIGNCYAYGAAVYALSCGLLIRPIVSRFSNHTTLLYALISCGLSIGMLLFHGSPLWLWLYIPIQQFSIALFWPTASAIASNAVSKEMQGEILGALQSVDSLGFALSPLIAGPLLGLSSSAPLAVGCLTILAAALVLGLSLGERQVEGVHDPS